MEYRNFLAAILFCFVLCSANANEDTQEKYVLTTPQNTAASNFQARFDCARVRNVVENLICHDAQLAYYDGKLAEVEKVARSVGADSLKLDAYIQHQEYLRNRFCIDRDCLGIWYSKQMEAMAYVIRTGTIPDTPKNSDAD